MGLRLKLSMQFKVSACSSHKPISQRDPAPSFLGTLTVFCARFSFSVPGSLQLLPEPRALLVYSSFPWYEESRAKPQVPGDTRDKVAQTFHKPSDSVSCFRVSV